MARFKNILLVEDDPITVLVCDRILKSSEFAEVVISKTNGLEGINYINSLIEAKQNLPEIIFLDINMPVMNGWDFLEEFSKAKLAIENIPKVYILSSTVDPEDFKKAEKYSCVVKTISKPLTQQYLDEIR